MNTTKGLSLALTVGLALLGASADAARPPAELDGSVTSVQGATVEILGGRVRLDATSARIVRRADGAALGIADVTPGARVHVLVGTARPDGALPAVEIRLGEAETTEMNGPLTSVDVAGKTFGLAGSVVSTNDDTFFSGETARGPVRTLADLASGDFVEARVDASGSGLLAVSVHAERAPAPAEATEVEFKGTVSMISGDQWTIGDKTVSVTAQTVIKGDPKVGDEVEVKAIDAGGGMLLAVRIQKEDGDDDPANPPGNPPGDDHGGGAGTGTGGTGGTGHSGDDGSGHAGSGDGGGGSGSTGTGTGSGSGGTGGGDDGGGHDGGGHDGTGHDGSGHH